MGKLTAFVLELSVHLRAPRAGMPSRLAWNMDGAVALHLVRQILPISSLFLCVFFHSVLSIFQSIYLSLFVPSFLSLDLLNHLKPLVLSSVSCNAFHRLRLWPPDDCKGLFLTLWLQDICGWDSNKSEAPAVDSHHDAWPPKWP